MSKSRLTFAREVCNNPSSPMDAISARILPPIAINEGNRINIAEANGALYEL